MPAFKNLTGKKFGRLTAIRPLKERRNGFVMWLCVCECKKPTEVRSNRLLSGGTQSCGCVRGKDLTGQKFGKLRVIRSTGKRYHGGLVWLCECEGCGKTTNMCNGTLSRGAQSCGCENTRTCKEKGIGIFAAENADKGRQREKEMGVAVFDPENANKGRHVRWHVMRDRVNPKCHFCMDEGGTW